MINIAVSYVYILEFFAMFHNSLTDFKTIS